MIANLAQAANDRALDLADAQGAAVARFAWKPKRPGGAIVASVAPFIVLALAGFALLVVLGIRYMRRTAEEIATGERQLRHLALHDPVCGLPNRIFFGERLEQTINDVRGGGPSAAVFYIDLDHFKDVNDTLGHHIGDELILNVTQRLSRIMRGDDLVARLGGDEFAIITTCASDSYSLQAIAGRIIAAVCAPYLISGHNIIIGASIGIAAIDRRVGDAADILRYADMALYRAKNEGRNRACIYDAAMDADLSNRKVAGRRSAAGDQERWTCAPPISRSSMPRAIPWSASKRWRAGRIRSTARFRRRASFRSPSIPGSSSSSANGCCGAPASKAATGRASTVAVNVSPLQFRRSDFVELVERILTETDFDANRLELELTESTLLGNLETAELSMLRLKAIGVRFALDDFGTGYSSLLYLRRFPFDKLKIDFELRALDRKSARRRRHRACRCQPRPRPRHEGHRGRRRDRRAASVPARRRRAFDAGLPIRQARAPQTRSITGSPTPTIIASAAPTTKSRWRADGLPSSGGAQKARAGNP